MSTDIRPELSIKNEYWISRHRYYELKHFCLQYRAWKKAYALLQDYERTHKDDICVKSSNVSNPTEEVACKLAYFAERIKMVEDAAKQTDDFFADVILRSVTEGLTYTYFSTKESIPCCRDSYYEMYRKFFYILHCMRN